MQQLKFMIIGLIAGLFLGIIGVLYFTEPEIVSYVEYKQPKIDTLYVDVPTDPIHISIKDTKIIRDTIKIESSQNSVVLLSDYLSELETKSADEFPMIINGTNLYISPPLTYAIQNRVIDGDTLTASCRFPTGEFEFLLKQKPHKMRTVQIETFIKKETPWYDKTWARVSTHSICILTTIWAVK